MTDLDDAEKCRAWAAEAIGKKDFEMAIVHAVASLTRTHKHLRASQPATETASKERVARALDSFLAPTDPQPATQPVEGVSDEELTAVYYTGFRTVQPAAGPTATPTHGEHAMMQRAGNRAVFNLGASRSSSAKDARIAELENQASMACIEPAPKCQCAGCLYARERAEEPTP